MKMSAKDIPTWLSHRPIVSVDYEKQDANANDAKFLSIGKSTWNEDDISAKIWRKDNNDRWSRESEEMPLWRVLDLAKLVIATITGRKSSLNETVINNSAIEFLHDFINDNMVLYSPRLKELQELLISRSQKNYSNVVTPNLFSFATSELSQDAVFCWLIQWADDSYIKEDRSLCMLGKRFLSLLTDIPINEIHSINVGRQWANIDIWVEINDDTVLIVEDKIETCIHSGQDIRYKETVHAEYKDKRSNQLFSYIKTGNESLSKLKEIESHGYRTINRRDILSVLNRYEGNNPIVTDYRSHLQQMEDETNGYKYKPVKNWGWYEWQGFYQELELHFTDADWNYVPNSSGGFLGFWWHSRSNDEVTMYLQFEQDKVCVKIVYEGEDNRSEVRNKYYEMLNREAGKLGVKIERPKRFGSGIYMTIGIIPSKIIFGNDCIDIDMIVKILHEYENVVNDCINQTI